GLRGTTVRSISPACIRRATTAATRRSCRNLGKMRPLLGPPTWWPARPMRCSPLATEVGASTCSTRSMAPMPMRSSNLPVAPSAPHDQVVVALDQLAQLARVLDGHDELELERLAHAGVDDRRWPRLAVGPMPAEEAGELAGGPLGGRQPDALRRPAAQAFETL